MKITKSQLRLIIEKQFRAGKKSHEPSFSLDDYPGYSNFYGRGGGTGGSYDSYDDYDYSSVIGEDPDLVDDDLGDAGYDPEDYEADTDDIGDDLGEGKAVKVTKRQLKRIIEEEKAKVLREQANRGNPNKPWDAVFPPEEATPEKAPSSDFGIFDKYYLTNVLMEEVERFMDETGVDSFGPAEIEDMRDAVMYALDTVTKQVS